MPPVQYDGITELRFNYFEALARCFSNEEYFRLIRPTRRAFSIFAVANFIVSRENTIVGRRSQFAWSGMVRGQTGACIVSREERVSNQRIRFWRRGCLEGSGSFDPSGAFPSVGRREPAPPHASACSGLVCRKDSRLSSMAFIHTVWWVGAMMPVIVEA